MASTATFLAVLTLTLTSTEQASAFTYQQSDYWETTDCTGAPFYMDIFPEFNCGKRNITYNCSPYTFNDTEYYRTVICVADTHEWTKSYYETTDYIMVEQFDTTSDDCDEYFEGRVFLANDSCVKMINSTTASVGSDGSQSLELFTDNACSTTAAKSFSVDSAVVSNHSCYDSEYKFYSESEYTSGSGSYSDSDGESESQGSASAASSESGETTSQGSATGSSSESGATESQGSVRDASSESGSSSGSSAAVVGEATTSSGLGTGIIVVLVIVAVVVATGISWLVFWWGRRSAARKQESTNATLADEAKGGGEFVNMAESAPSRTADEMFTAKSDGDGSALWRDEAILGARVPREKVVIQQLISRGWYGEVYMGTYNGQEVAVKMLLPETRKSNAHRIAFLAEIRLMAVLEHQRIVHLVGVAWDSPNDLCALTEFMAGGDLRALLNKYDAEHRPIGFTYEKVKIALHVAHALTYLHSLGPPVVHRDLKSKNILLTHDLDAKLTDFGVSRERADRTMTAAVGTFLWMSPEVMMGERYDAKADIFSFGVVLSELNTHTIPYAHVKSRDGSGGRMPDTAILQLVAAGRLRADFSQGGPDSLMQLGLLCVSVDPKSRPSTPEVLYHLQTAMKEMSSN